MSEDKGVQQEQLQRTVGGSWLNQPTDAELYKLALKLGWENAESKEHLIDNSYRDVFAYGFKDGYLACYRAKEAALSQQQGKEGGDNTHLIGWECPRCQTIHSPFVLACGCPPPTVTTTGIDMSFVNF